MPIKAQRKNRGKKHHNWKGNKVGYGALHNWLRRNFGNATFCANNPTHTSKYFEWANISGKYKRDIKDFKPLCMSCHRKMDFTEKTRLTLREISKHQHYAAIPVKQYDKNGIFIQSFNSNREASLKLKIDKSSICAASKGDRKSAGGFIWKR